LMGLHRQGDHSTGGGTRLLRCADGWWALNLARDADLVPALIGASVIGDPWSAISAWSAGVPGATIRARTSMLGLAASLLSEVSAPARPWSFRPWPTGPDSDVGQRPGARAGAPLVVNLGALWAGPLAARLLGMAGAEVLHVESAARPDPTRDQAPDFFTALRGNGRFLRVDFTQPNQVRSVLEQADVVIEASRPRALERLGIGRDELMSRPGPRLWLRITGHRDPLRVAFSDDAAVAGGLVGWDAAQPVFAGDAIADPLTGLLAGLAATTLLARGGRWSADLHLADVAAYCAIAGVRSAD
jgi:CoA-transferase family III